jgi:hydrogenase nickel incorporation protein HypA/HybF
MHEMGMAYSVLHTLREEAARRRASRVRKIGLRIGELAAVDPEGLRFCFEALTRGTDLESVGLDIEIRARRHHCRDCGAEFNVMDCDFACPQCRCLDSECISGDELEIAYLEVEEHEPTPA